MLDDSSWQLKAASVCPVDIFMPGHVMLHVCFESADKHHCVIVRFVQS